MLIALGFAALSVLMFISYQQARAEGSTMSVSFYPYTAIPLIVLGILVPMSVWKGEEPSRRSYLSSLPVERGGHVLLKSFHGWLWFMVLLVLFLLWMWAVAALTDGAIGVVEERLFLGDPAGRGLDSLRDADVVRLDWTVPGWMWAVPFTAATTTYLLGSAVVLASNHPWRWLAGIAVSFFLLVVVAEAAKLPGLEQALDDVVTGRYGIGGLVTGMYESVQTVTGRGGRVVQHPVVRPDLGGWLGATALWMGLGIAGTLAAALRHREP